MKYKPGDKVRVREDLEAYREYRMESGYTDTAVEEMLLFRGKIVTIFGFSDNAYLVEEDTENWNWTDEMFEDERKTDCVVSA